jgi:hypothetical protein
MKATPRLLLVGGLLAGGALVLAALLVAGSPAPASELRWSDPGGRYVPPPRECMRVNLDVLVNGRQLPTVYYRGRTYLPVPWMGAEYQLRVWNGGPRRIVAILSVDGLSVINGRPASESSPGYIVAPHEAIVIDGWRRDLATVAAFQFVPRESSYAARMGYPENVGVIGLIAVEELAFQPLLEREHRDGLRADAKGAAPALGGVGTGYGRELDSRAYLVPFVRGPNRTPLTIYYDSAGALRRLGVPVGGPVPFPADGDFVPPPPPIYRDR